MIFGRVTFGSVHTWIGLCTNHSGLLPMVLVAGNLSRFLFAWDHTFIHWSVMDQQIYKLQTYCEWLTVWASVWNLNVLVTRVSWIGWELRRRRCPGGRCLGSSARNGHPSLAIVAVLFCIPSCCCPECLSLISKHLSVFRAVEHVSVWTYGHSLYHKHFFFLCQYGHFYWPCMKPPSARSLLGNFKNLYHCFDFICSWQALQILEWS